VVPRHNIGLEIVTATTPWSGLKMEKLIVTRYQGGLTESMEHLGVDGEMLHNGGLLPQ